MQPLGRVFTPAPVSPDAANTGLSGRWTGLPGLTGGPHIFDLLGRTRGTLTKTTGALPVWAATRFNQSGLTFDGTNYVDCGGGTAFDVTTGDFAVGLSFKLTGTSVGFFLAKTTGSSTNGYDILFNSSGAGKIDFRTNSGVALLSASGTWNDGLPHRLVCTRKGGSDSVYIDGARVAGPFTDTSTLTNTAAPLQFAGRNGTAFAGFTGWDWFVYTTFGVDTAWALRDYEWSLNSHRDPRIRIVPRRAWLPAPAGGDVTLSLAGQAATFAAGTLTPNTAVNLSGQPGAFAAGTLTPATDVALSGQPATFSAGTLTPGIAVTLSGIPATFSAGTLSPAIAVNLSGVTVVVSAGTLTPAGDVTVALTGQSVTVSAGSLVPGIAVTLSGAAATFAAGTLTPALSVTLVGGSATFATGTLTPSGGVHFVGPACGTITVLTRVDGGITILTRVAGTVTIEEC